MKRMIYMCALSISIYCASLSDMSITCQVSPIKSTSVAKSDQRIQPRAEIFEWRYKVVDGKLYKRLYNATRHKWAGEWIQVK